MVTRLDLARAALLVSVTTGRLHNYRASTLGWSRHGRGIRRAAGGGKRRREAARGARRTRARCSRKSPRRPRIPQRHLQTIEAGATSARAAGSAPRDRLLRNYARMVGLDPDADRRGGPRRARRARSRAAAAAGRHSSPAIRRAFPRARSGGSRRLPWSWSSPSCSPSARTVRLAALSSCRRWSTRRRLHKDRRGVSASAWRQRRPRRRPAAKSCSPRLRGDLGQVL